MTITLLIGQSLREPIIYFEPQNWKIEMSPGLSHISKADFVDSLFLIKMCLYTCNWTDGDVSSNVCFVNVNIPGHYPLRRKKKPMNQVQPNQNFQKW